MSSDEADEQTAYGEFYHDNQPVIVASDIEDIVPVADIISRRKVLANVLQRKSECVRICQSADISSDAPASG